MSRQTRETAFHNADASEFARAVFFGRNVCTILNLAMGKSGFLLFTYLLYAGAPRHLEKGSIKHVNINFYGRPME